MKLRLYNAKILKMTDDTIINGEVQVDENIITYVGDTQNAPKNINFEREIDMQGNLLMPSFKNLHTHSPMTFLRSHAEDLPLQEWLFDKIFPQEAKLTEKRAEPFIRLAFAEYIANGITTCFDMYFTNAAMAKIADEVGFRAVLCGAIDSNPENYTEKVAKLEADYLKYKNFSEYVSFRLGFHAEYTSCLDGLKAIGKLAEKYKAPVFMHNSETAFEVENCIAKYGKTPTELFEECGIFRYGGGGFHSAHMTENDMEIYKKNHVFAVSCPVSNAKLASGIAPIYEMLEKGIEVAIGTDSAASNNALDMFREILLLAQLQKLRKSNPAVLRCFSVLKMATTGGAKALGFNDLETLEVGQTADIIGIDLQKPNMIPAKNVINNLVYSCGNQNVYLTICNGKILYENGKYYTINIEEVLAEANALSEEIIAE